jgi:hypothetical protein
MTGLFIRIVQEKRDKTGLCEFSISCDNVTNESASKEEIIIANRIETYLSEILRMKADKVLQFDMTQKSPDKEQTK